MVYSAEVTAAIALSIACHVVLDISPLFFGNKKAPNRVL